MTTDLKHTAASQASLKRLPSIVSLSPAGKKQESNLAFPAVTYSTRSIPYTTPLRTSQNGTQQRVGYPTTQ